MNGRESWTGATAVLAAIFVSIAVASVGDGDESRPVVGVWPAEVERAFVEDTVASGFLDRFSAQCVREQLQQEMSVEQFEAGLAGGSSAGAFGDAYSRALAQYTLIRGKEPGA